MGWLRRLRDTISPRASAVRFDEEIQFHLDALTKDHERRGLSPHEARLAALRRFGNVPLARERTGDADTFRWLTDAGKDGRFAVRLLRKNPGFAMAAILTLALGIGATTAVFTVVRAVLLKPLPYTDPRGLVVVRVDSSRGMRQPILTTQEFVGLRQQTDVFTDLASIFGFEAILTGADDVEAEAGVFVTDGFLGVLGVKPLLGRPLEVKRDQTLRTIAGAAISHELWQRRWHGDPSIVGRQIQINDLALTVVAVMPPGLELHFGPGVPVPRHVDVWLPTDPSQDAPTVPGYPAIGRLRPSVSMAAAQSAINIFAERFVATHPADYKTGGIRLSLASLPDDIVRDVRPALLALSGAVAFVLLVSCANLTNLLLGRVCARTRELAIRTAVGASRGQLIRQLLAESLVLGILGGAAGLVVARVGITTLMRLAPAGLLADTVMHFDAGILLFAAGVSLTSSLIFGLVPAWQTTSDVASSMKTDPASRSSVTRGALVASQVALSLILLVGAGLMARTFSALQQVALGYETSRVLTVRAPVSFRQFKKREDTQTFYQRALEAVRAIPGVQRAGVVSPAPFDDRTVYRRIALGPTAPEFAAYQPTALPGYFGALGLHVLEGRDFVDGDITTQERTPIIIDRVLASRLWPGQPAAGRRVLLSPHANSEHWAEVVGVVDHARVQDVRDDGLPQIYVTWQHRPSLDMTFVVRTRADPRAMGATVKDTIDKLGPGRPSHASRILQDLVDAQRADTRFALLVLGIFAAFAVALTAIGVYGVVSYATARRTQEIAIRRALGAQGADIFTLVMRDGSGWIAAGILGGALGARLLTRSLQSLLFQVQPADPVTFISVGVLLAAIALVATALPAIRAIRIDPMRTLRAE